MTANCESLNESGPTSACVLMPRYLVPIGGNEKKSPDSEIFREMVGLAGGSKARIVVVPTASEAPGDRARDYQELFSAIRSGEHSGRSYRRTA